MDLGVVEAVVVVQDVGVGVGRKWVVVVCVGSALQLRFSVLLLKATVLTIIEITHRNSSYSAETE